MAVGEMDYQRLHNYALRLVDELEAALMDWNEGTSNEAPLRKKVNAKRGYLKRLRNEAARNR